MPVSTVPPFMGAVRAASPEGHDAAVFGAPHGTPYPEINNAIHRGAPDAVRAALAASSEDTDLIVLDPTSDTEFVIRRPAVWAVARDFGGAWHPWIATIRTERDAKGHLIRAFATGARFCGHTEDPGCKSTRCKSDA